jgi:hypothetical protein
VRLLTTSLALLAWLVRVSVSLPHGAEAAPKVIRPVPPAVGQQHQQGQHGGGPTAIPEASATLLLALGLEGVGALEWWRRKHAAEGQGS